MLKCLQSAGLRDDAAMLMDFLGREIATKPQRSDALRWWRRQVC